MEGSELANGTANGNGGKWESYNNSLYTRNLDIVSCICSFLGGAANLVSMCVLCTSSLKKKRSGKLLINLAFANVIFCAILLLYAALDAARLTAETRHNDNVTVLQSELKHDFLYDVPLDKDVSVWYDSSPLSCLYHFSVSLEWIREFFPFLATTWLVVDQFLGVAFPLRRNLVMTERVVVIVIVSTYAIPVLYLSVSTVTGVANQTNLDCTVIFFNRYRHMRYLDPHFVANGAFVTSVFVINLVLYIFLMVIVKRQREHMKMGSCIPATRQNKKDSKVYKIVGILFSTLAIFWSPMVILYFLTIFNEGVIASWIIDTVAFVAVLNPIADAVVYGVRLEQVRKVYSSFLRRFKRTCSVNS